MVLKKILTLVGSTALIGLISLVLLELLLSWTLHHPRYSVLPMPLLKTLYKREFRAVIQTQEECMKYDDYVTYTLDPGRCEFSNFEFDTIVTANSVGLRADEEALEKPDLIFLGDSTTMGWGVGDSEAFPNLVGQIAGYRSLNAGVSSYGTVREVRLLERLDVSNLEYLFVQYCKNDLGENEDYSEQGTIEITDESTFREFARTYRDQRSYFPGHYSVATLLHLWWSITDPDRFTRSNASAPALASEVDYFLQALEPLQTLVPEAQLVLFETNGIGDNRPEFASLLEQRLADRETPDLIKSAIVVDTSVLSSTENYYPMDGHLNKAGHIALAHLLVSQVFESGESDE